MIPISENTVVKDGFFVELRYYGGGCCFSGETRALVIVGKRHLDGRAEWIQAHDFRLPALD